MDKLTRTFQRLSRLSHLGAICGWDEAVNMPTGGGDARASALAELAVLQAEILQNPEIADLFSEAEQLSDSLPEIDQLHLREMKRSWNLATALPLDLVEKISLAASRCEQAWRVMRPDNNWQDFKPLLAEVFVLAKEEAALRAEASGLAPYEAMMDLYERGARSERISSHFDELRTTLPPLIEAIREKQKPDTVHLPQGHFPAHRQKALGEQVMKTLGFDFAHGRLDVSHHPFCGGVPTDVRLTTRYNENDFIEGLMGVIHETGHACYEQGLPGEWGEMPLGQSLSMSIHESQSLLFELQVGRNPLFLHYLAPLLREHFPETDRATFDVANLEKLYSRVAPGYIRVNADEATYPIHVILRYDIEKALIEEEMTVDDIPDAWNDAMQAGLGLSTKDNYKDGCMQDVHWPSGAVGYFPSYTLGAMSAAQIFGAMRKSLPGLDDDLRSGEFGEMRSWLKKNIWSQGSALSVDELMVHATGETLKTDAFLQHLTHRYLGA